VYCTVFGLGAIDVMTRSLAGAMFGVICSELQVVSGTGTPVSEIPASLIVRPALASRPDGSSLNVLHVGSQGLSAHATGGLNV
jgi:hypothetical protein